MLLFWLHSNFTRCLAETESFINATYIHFHVNQTSLSITKHLKALFYIQVCGAFINASVLCCTAIKHLKPFILHTGLSGIYKCFCFGYTAIKHLKVVILHTGVWGMYECFCYYTAIKHLKVVILHTGVWGIYKCLFWLHSN